MQDPIKKSTLQASDFLPTSKAAPNSLQPELSSSLSINLPAYYDLDQKYIASPSEIWSFCLYLVANFGVTLANFAPTAFQNLLAQAAGDAGVLLFAGR